MITKHNLQEAIAECEGQRNPTANTCLKLAAFYIIQDRMFPKEAVKEPMFYSTQQGDTFVNETVEYTSDTEFGRVVVGMDVDEIMPIVDELMTTLQVLMPKLYDAVMQKISTR